MNTLKCQNCNGELNPVNGVGLVIKCEYCNTPNLLGTKFNLYLQSKGHPFLVWLLDVMSETISLDELQDLCYKMVFTTGDNTYQYDNYAGGKNAKIRELILACQRRYTVSHLVELAMTTSRGLALKIEAYND